MSQNEKTIENVVKTSSERIAEIIDVNTVIGQTIVTPSGFHVIPFTKVTVAQLSGSGEYGETKILGDPNDHQAGASGFLVNIKPEGFLVDDGKTCRIMNASDDPASIMIEKVSEFLSNFSAKHE